MNQLFYNMWSWASNLRWKTDNNIRSDCKILSKIGIGFISNFLLKVQVLYLTILKRKFKLTFEGWNRPFCHLSGFTTVSFCQDLLHFNLEQWSELWWRWWRVSLRLFFSFPASFKNSNLREKVGNCLRFGTGGWSLHANNGRWREKKHFWQSDLLARSECTILDLEHAYVYWIWLRGFASYVIIQIGRDISSYLINHYLANLHILKT